MTSRELRKKRICMICARKSARRRLFSRSRRGGRTVAVGAGLCWDTDQSAMCENTNDKVVEMALTDIDPCGNKPLLYLSRPWHEQPASADRDAMLTEPATNPPVRRETTRGWLAIFRPAPPLPVTLDGPGANHDGRMWRRWADAGLDFCDVRLRDVLFLVRQKPVILPCASMGKRAGGDLALENF